MACLRQPSSFALVLACLALAACGAPARPRSRPEVGQAAPPALSASMAALDAQSRADIARRHPPGYPGPTETFRGLRHRFDDRGWADPMAGMLVMATRDGFALMSLGAPTDCHFCAATMAVTYFRRAGAGWQEGRTWENVFVGGEQGGMSIWPDSAAPDPFRTENGPIGLGLSNPTVIVDDLHGGHGDMDSYFGVVELTPARPVMRLRGALYDSFTVGTTAADDSCEIHGTATPLVGRPGIQVHLTGHFPHRRKVDLVVRYSGTERWRANRPLRGLECSQRCGDRICPAMPGSYVFDAPARLVVNGRDPEAP